MAPMTMTSLQFRTRVRLTLLTSAVVAAVTFTGAQQPAIPAAVLAASLDQTVPVDPLITVGTLPNGFRYYIRENRQPQRRSDADRFRPLSLQAPPPPGSGRPLVSLLKRSSSATFERTRVLVTTITARTLRREIVTSRPLRYVGVA